MVEPIGIDTDNFTASAESETDVLYARDAQELQKYGIQCETKISSMVLNLLIHCFEELKTLAREGYQINILAIARQFASALDTEDWNSIISPPKTNSYAQFVAYTQLHRNYDDQQLVMQAYGSIKEHSITKIGDCIGLLLETKQKVYEEHVKFSITDLTKFIRALSNSAAV